MTIMQRRSYRRANRPRHRTTDHSSAQEVPGLTLTLDRLYPDIDLAETLSCVTGKWIKRITADDVEFTDGSKQSLSKPDWRLLKPLIFWGPIV